MSNKSSRRTNQQAPAESSRSWTEREFLNVTLSDRERVELKQQDNTFEFFDESLLELVDSGYSFSLKWDPRGNAYACWMIQQRPEHENYGYILAGRGSTPLKALKQVIYIHYKLAKGVWSDFAKKSSRDEIDD